MKKFIAENGEELIARDEVQEAAFEKAGLTPADDKPKKAKD